MWIVAFEDFEEESGTGLDVALAAAGFAGWGVEDEAGDAGDFPKLAAGELGGVHAGDEVFEEVFFG